MRINQFIARATGISRRKADEMIVSGDVLVNGKQPRPNYQVTQDDHVSFQGKQVKLKPVQTIILNKPVGYVCSRQGQDNKTIYELLPESLRHLKPVGRLDKDSSGLLLLTNDGELANQLTHPRYAKEKTYIVCLDRSLAPEHLLRIKQGVMISDGVSKLGIRREKNGDKKEKHAAKPHASRPTPISAAYEVRIREGRNRQIRRTFAALGYRVKSLHRTHFGPYMLSSIMPSSWRSV